MRRSLALFTVAFAITGWTFAQTSGGTNAGAAAAGSTTPAAARGAASPVAMPSPGVSGSVANGGNPTAAGQAQPATNTTTNNSLANTGGGVSTSAPMNAPLVVTPSVALGNTSTNPVGATSAPGGLQVGASSNAISSSAPVQNGVTTQPIVNNPNTTAVNATGAVVPSEVASGGLNIYAPSSASFSNIGASTSASNNGQSLGDLARYYKAHATRAAKTYTNDDIARLNQNGQRSDISVVGSQALDQRNPGSSALPASDDTNVGGRNAALPNDSQPANQQNVAPQNAHPETVPAATRPVSPANDQAPQQKPTPYIPPQTPPQQ